MKRLPRDLLLALGILACAVALGLLQNALAAPPLPLTGVPEPEITTLTTPAEVQAALTAGAHLVDSREMGDYIAGHLQGARSLPNSQREQRLSELQRSVPSSRPLVVYCDQDCDSATRLAAWLSERGWREVAVFTGGYSVWRQAGLPVSEGARP